MIDVIIIKLLLLLLFTIESETNNSEWIMELI